MSEEPQTPSVSPTAARYLRDRRLDIDYEQRQRGIAFDEAIQNELIFNAADGVLPDDWSVH
jgi:hypothetical protein